MYVCRSIRSKVQVGAVGHHAAPVGPLTVSMILVGRHTKLPVLNKTEESLHLILFHATHILLQVAEHIPPLCC